MSSSAKRLKRRKFHLIVAILTLFALVFRVLYFLSAQVDVPIRGDIAQYWNYAGNLVFSQTFSSSNAEHVTPDSFRGPGYPAFIAVFMLFTDSPKYALLYTQGASMVLGSLLVPLSVGLARSVLGPLAAIGAGVLVALSPHLVVFSSTLLSETFFSSTLLVMMCLMVAAQRKGNATLGSAAGVAAAVSYLTNPVILLFPLVAAGLLVLRRQFRVAVFLLIAFVAVVGVWEARNAFIPPSAKPGRAATNLVQGSWPLYHDAYRDRFRNEIAKNVSVAINEEIALFSADRPAGLRSIADRFEQNPVYYLRWYFLEKPYLLWDWSIRIGWGDVYFLETLHSPYDTNPVMHSVHSLFRWLNPVFFLLACVAALLAALRVRRADASYGALLVAGLFVYLTAIHVVFQAEPRYAVAYRPFEFLLAVLALSEGYMVLKRRTGNAG